MKKLGLKEVSSLIPAPPASLTLRINAGTNYHGTTASLYEKGQELTEYPTGHWSCWRTPRCAQGGCRLHGGHDRPPARSGCTSIPFPGVAMTPDDESGFRLRSPLDSRISVCSLSYSAPESGTHFRRRKYLLHELDDPSTSTNSRIANRLERVRPRHPALVACH